MSVPVTPAAPAATTTSATPAKTPGRLDRMGGGAWKGDNTSASKTGLTFGAKRPTAPKPAAPAPAPAAAAAPTTPGRGPDGKFTAAEKPAAAEPVAKPAEAPESTGEPTTTPEPRKFKVKVKGQEREVTEADLLRNYEKGEGADERFREAAEVKKRVAQLENLRKTDFKKFVQEMAKEAGHDLSKTAQDLLLEEANRFIEEQELAKMSPEERELHEFRKEKAAREATEKAAAEEKAKAEKAETAQKVYQSATGKLVEIHKLMPESIRGDKIASGRAGMLIGQHVDALAAAVDPKMPVEQFLAGLDIKGIASTVLKEMKADAARLLKTLPEAEMDELLDPEVSARWTRRLQSQAQKRAHPALVAQPAVGDGKARPQEEKKQGGSLRERAPGMTFKPAGRLRR